MTTTEEALLVLSILLAICLLMASLIKD